MPWTPNKIKNYLKEIFLYIHTPHPLFQVNHNVILYILEIMSVFNCVFTTNLELLKHDFMNFKLISATMRKYTMTHNVY
jgi:hypothetical protein